MPVIKTALSAAGKDMLDCSQMQDWEIAIATDAIPAEHYAAEEFQRFFNQATGLDLPLRPLETPAPHQVCIGAATSATTALGEEGFCIEVEKDRLSIAGGRPRGVLYGVYQLLEEGLGLRFLTHDHIYIPEASGAKIPCGTYTYVPPLSFRFSAYHENIEHPEGGTRLRGNTFTDDERLGGRTGQQLINHSFHRLVPFDRHGADHPEYYALVDGERDTDTRLAGPQLCVTNPEVVDVAAAAAIESLDQDPGLQNISVSQADTRRYCRCAPCEEVNQREGSPMGSHLEFVNAVAARVGKAYPHVKVGTLAYQYTRQAPRTVRPEPNVQIQLCSIECCTLHAIDDPECEKNRAFCRDMNAWGAICDDIWIWNYNTNFRHYTLPFPNLRSIAPNMRYFVSNNAKGAFMQANHNGLTGELSDLRNYIMSQLLWDPQLDGDRLREEFIRLHYEAAAQPILDYIGLLHDNAESKEQHPSCFPTLEDLGLDRKMAGKALDYFAQALELSSSAAVRARVEKASICAYKAKIVTGSPIDEGRGELIEHYIALCRRYNLTRGSEQVPAEQYFAELV
jgi:hypothetical protein